MRVRNLGVVHCRLVDCRMLQSVVNMAKCSQRVVRFSDYYVTKPDSMKGIAGEQKMLEYV